VITLEFFGILAFSLICYWLVPKQSIRNMILITASFAYLYLTDKWSVVLVLGLSVLSYLFGILIARHPKRGWIHTLGLVSVLAVLIIFKYLGFLDGILHSLAGFIEFLPSFRIDKLIMPLGISYIVFKHISFLTDVKWGLVKPGRYGDFLLYSSLFTIFVAGPIERYERFRPQIDHEEVRFVWNDLDYGFGRIVLGMFKKLVFADWLGYFINPIWQNSHHYSAWIGLLALLGYSLQIYFDFSGYSDIAIGASRLFGIRIMENFRNPYLAPNISQFWRRWHISLSDWIRDYLFFPLSRISSTRIWSIFFVPVIAMAICGLWHGPAWHFVLWGAWHGIGLTAYQLWSEQKRQNKQLAKATKQGWFGIAAVIMNFSFVTLGWWWFRG